jgi:ADP-heptose:LPS heptosyltransferase
LLIPGAGRPHKIWAPENFARIADYLNRQYDYEIIISGSPSERGIAESVIGKSSVPINNRIEDSDLLDLMKLVQNSEIVITNETSAVHFAAAMDKKAVCISDGSYFGRFHPYPREMTDKIVYIYPHQISENFDNFKVVFEKYSGVSNLDINSITVDKVISAIEKLIKVGGIEQKC